MPRARPEGSSRATARWTASRPFLPSRSADLRDPRTEGNEPWHEPRARTVSSTALPPPGRAATDGPKPVGRARSRGAPRCCPRTTPPPPAGSTRIGHPAPSRQTVAPRSGLSPCVPKHSGSASRTRARLLHAGEQRSAMTDTMTAAWPAQPPSEQNASSNGSGTIGDRFREVLARFRETNPTFLIDDDVDAPLPPGDADPWLRDPVRAQRHRQDLARPGLRDDGAGSGPAGGGRPQLVLERGPAGLPVSVRRLLPPHAVQRVRARRRRANGTRPRPGEPARLANTT